MSSLNTGTIPVHFDSIGSIYIKTSSSIIQYPNFTNHTESNLPIHMYIIQSIYTLKQNNDLQLLIFGRIFNI